MARQPSSHPSRKIGLHCRRAEGESGRATRGRISSDSSSDLRFYYFGRTLYESAGSAIWHCRPCHPQLVAEGNPNLSLWQRATPSLLPRHPFCLAFLSETVGSGTHAAAACMAPRTMPLLSRWNFETRQNKGVYSLSGKSVDLTQEDQR